MRPLTEFPFARPKVYSVGFLEGALNFKHVFRLKTKTHETLITVNLIQDFVYCFHVFHKGITSQTRLPYPKNVSITLACLDYMEPWAVYELEHR